MRDEIFLCSCVFCDKDYVGTDEDVDICYNCKEKGLTAKDLNRKEDDMKTEKA